MRDILNENNKYQEKHQESIKYFGHNLFSSSNNLKKKKRNSSFGIIHTSFVIQVSIKWAFLKKKFKNI